MISIIIPTYNEETVIGKLITHLQNDEDGKNIVEIIVSDGGSKDATEQRVMATGVTFLKSQKKGRAAQMNAGAAIAKAPILYFLHADSFPPAGFTTAIMQKIREGYGSGCYRLQFDYNHWFLELNCWFTRFDVNAFRFGDQSLFVKREVFAQINGFDENLHVFEDQEIISRVRKYCRFKVLPDTIITAARKYHDNGVYRTQAIYFLLYFMYKFGYSQEHMINKYRSLIKQDKL